MIILKMNSREYQTLQTEGLKKARKVRGQKIVGYRAQIWKNLVTPPSLLSQRTIVFVSSVETESFEQVIPYFIA